MIHADIQWRERYVSHALNRKFAGVIPTGIYQGFDCRISGNAVMVGGGEESIAVVETEGYSITLRMTEEERVPFNAGNPYVVIDARYAVGVATRADLKAVSAPAPEQIVLCKVVDNGSGWEVDNSERGLARPVRVDTTLAQLAEGHVTQFYRYLSLHERVEKGEAQAQEGLAKLTGRIEEVSRDREAATTMSLAKAATASVETMTRQVSMLDRLLAVEKAAHI